jgi:hypothetical protein
MGVNKMSYLDKIILNENIKEAYYIVGEWEVLIGDQYVKIKIKRNFHELYFYDTSHNYQGTGQASGYNSNVNGLGSVLEAIEYAINQLTKFYIEEDHGAIWNLNINY